MRPASRRDALRWALLALAVLALAGVVALVLIGPRQLMAWSGSSAATERLVTGLLVTGTPSDPVVYVTSSDPRIGAGPNLRLLPVDTNSGVLSRLTRDGSGWRRTDLVRGLPRSAENHATNGMALDRRGDRLFVAQGGMTNKGAPSGWFGRLPEYALSGAILSVDLDAIGDRTYDLPTLDPGSGGDGPFGGRAGRNQAVPEPDGPVQVYAPGFRNPYDLVLTSEDRLYAIDNGAAFYWGAEPAEGECVHEPREPGSYDADSLHLVQEGEFGGHANPTRGSGAGLSTTGEGRALPPTDPRQCDYLPVPERNPLATFPTSTNGLAEYTATNLDGAFRGDLLAASFDQRVHRISLAPDGESVDSTAPLFTVQGLPLDVTTQGDDAPFPGTIWIADYFGTELVVHEPEDFEERRHWRARAPAPSPRQEVSYVELGGNFYLTGGGTAHEAYDPATDTWRSLEPLPRRLDHIQGVALGGRIYYIGGLEDFPGPASSEIYVYDPRTNEFATGAPMPRPRGGGGLAVHEGKIYYAGGLHEGEAVPWFDEYDPSTDRWTGLPDMPRTRDHFHAAVVDGALFAIGGRDTDIRATIRETDSFDFERGVWSSDHAPIPTPRGGFAAAVVGSEILVLGGEVHERAFATVEAYDVRTDSWRALDPMPTPRHGIQAAVCGSEIFVAAGGAAPYGAAPTAAHESYLLDPERPCVPPEEDGEIAEEADGFREARVAAGTTNPTSLQFGPDGRLYVAEQSGLVKALSIVRSSSAAGGAYEVVDTEIIDAIQSIPNHNDDGTSATSWRNFARTLGARVGICCTGDVEGPPARRDPADSPPDPDRGREVYEATGCAGCHAFGGVGADALSGPPLDHLRGLSRDYVRAAIVDPDAAIVPGYGPGRMPDYYGTVLTEQELEDLLEFLTRR